MRVIVDGQDFDVDLFGAETIGIVRAAVARALLADGRCIVSCSVDGMPDPPAHAGLEGLSCLAITTQPHWACVKNGRVTLSGEDETMTFDGKTLLAEAVAVFDAALRPRRMRVTALTAAGADVTDVLSMSKPCGSFDALSCVVSKIRGERRAVVTLVLGSGFKRIADLCAPFMHSYAKAHHADFHCITAPRIGLPFPHFEKWQLMSLFAKYERIMFVDSDVLLDPRAPDIFAAVPAESVGAFDESPYGPRDEVIADAQHELGPIAWTHGYLNSGIGVYSYLHRPLFVATEHDIVLRAHFFEQTTYNYRIAKYGYPVEPLPWQWNCMDNNGHDRFAAYAVHYAGSGYTGCGDLDATTFFTKKSEGIVKDIALRFGGA